MNALHLFFAASALLIFILALNISRLRIQEQVANGDGGNRKIKQAIRAHMNSLEHILPYALVLYVLFQQGLDATYFNLLAFGFLGVRIAHSFSMLGSKFQLRRVTAALNYLFEFSAAISALYLAI